MPADSFDEEDDNVEGFGSGIGSASQPAQKASYASTGGTTPYGGSSGFVNLGQMLALNRQSGTDSANQLNKSVSDQGARAEAGVNNALSTFKTQADAASNKFDPNANLSDAQKGAQFGDYQGPKELDDVGKLPDGVKEEDRDSGMNMSKVRGDVSAAQDRANALGAPGGPAAEAAMMQSLSPRQSAASAFYMGSSNPNFKATTDRFKGLGDMLTNASKSAQDYGKGAINTTAANTRNYGGLLAQRQNQRDDAQRAEDINQRRIADLNGSKQRQAADSAYARNNRTGASSVNQIDGHTQAANLGMTYEQWLAAGSPTAQDYNPPQNGTKGNH